MSNGEGCHALVQRVRHVFQLSIALFDLALAIESTRIVESLVGKNECLLRPPRRVLFSLELDYQRLRRELHRTHRAQQQDVKAAPLSKKPHRPASFSKILALWRAINSWSGNLPLLSSRNCR